MRQQIDALGIKGSVLVIRKGKILLNYADSNTTDTSYLINSAQKSLTAAMVMRLVQDGKLSLQDRLSKFYPEIPGAKKIKIEHLLAMRAGLNLKPGAKLGRKHFVSDQDNIACDVKKTVFDPKLLGKWHYSSLNYVYLCGIITKVTNKSYEQLFHETYVEPLKLKHTEFLWSKPHRILKSGLVPGFFYRNGHYDIIKHEAALRDAHNELGAGSVVMSNQDLAKAIRYVLTGNLLTKRSRKLLYDAQPPSYYNGGLYHNDKQKTKLANGAGEGYYTFMRTTNDAKTMIIIQSNRTRKNEFDKLKKSVNQVMSQLLESQ